MVHDMNPKWLVKTIENMRKRNAVNEGNLLVDCRGIMMMCNIYMGAIWLCIQKVKIVAWNEWFVH